MSGTAAKFEKAFSTSFERYRLAGQRIAYANTESPLFPGATAGDVQDVIGLDDLTVSEPVGLRPRRRLPILGRAPTRRDWRSAALLRRHESRH